jgi:CO/xanthine dehydrogenase FAD-binding subunit
MGGGTWLNLPHVEDFSVVDLQSLGLNHIRKAGNGLEIEACVTLQQLIEANDCPETLKQALRVDAALNIRNAATVAGSLVTCDGRSAFATCMLAFDGRLTIRTGQATSVIGLSEFLALRPSGLVTSITISTNGASAFEMVARSPMDKPIVCAAINCWPGGRTRLALGGTGKSPVLALDGADAEGSETEGVQAAARNAYHEAGDAWASAEYRAELAATLARRCLEKCLGS